MLQCCRISGYKQYVGRHKYFVPKRRTQAIVCSGAVEIKKPPSFPFVRIADQEDMKLALMLNVIDPNIGGVLIMGDRGTGKSVAVRALVEMLPEIDVVEGDPFNSDPKDTKLMSSEVIGKIERGEELKVTKMQRPLIELPLGATEDRICGTIDIEKALSEGIKALEPGLLAKANRGILYVDEVNLLDDGLVDVVLDSAASGINTVEREGVSIVHPAAFIMIGSGNPQEGELRPQLLDRFGLSVNVATMMDGQSRTQMVMDRIAFEKSPYNFCAQYEKEQEELRNKLEAARQRLNGGVEVEQDILLKVAELCSILGVEGLRGDIVINRSTKALVAFQGRRKVELEDVERVLGLCLNHRLRKDVLDQIDSGTKVALAWLKVLSPKKERQVKEQKLEDIEQQEPDEGGDKRAGLKPGAWGGLPS